MKDIRWQLAKLQVELLIVQNQLLELKDKKCLVG